MSQNVYLCKKIGNKYEKMIRYKIITIFRGFHRNRGKEMLKLAVCDDEKLYLDRIIRIIKDVFQHRGITDYKIDSYLSSQKLYKSSSLLDYDVIFLDINMPECSGLDVAKKIRDINSKVLLVFITAFADYAVDGYRMEAVRFVLKDMLEEMLIECVEAVIYKLSIQASKTTYAFLEGSRTLSLDNIYYIESQRHKLFFHVMQKNLVTYSIYAKLDDMEKEYTPYGFLRIHKSFLVNTHYIKEIRNYRVMLVNGMTLPVPKEKYQIIKERFYEIKGDL